MAVETCRVCVTSSGPWNEEWLFCCWTLQPYLGDGKPFLAQWLFLLYVQTFFLHQPTELSNCSILDFCRQFTYCPYNLLTWANLQPSHLSNFLIYVKPGLVGPGGTLFVSFIHPINKNSSLVPKQQLTDSTAKSGPICLNLALCMAQAQFSIKAFVLFGKPQFSF